MDSDTDQTGKAGSITVDRITLLTGIVGLASLTISYIFLFVLPIQLAIALYKGFIENGLYATCIISGIAVPVILLVAAVTRWMAHGVLSGRKAPAIVVVLFMLIFSLGGIALSAIGVYALRKGAVMLFQSIEVLIFSLLMCTSFFNTRYWKRQR